MESMSICRDSVIISLYISLTWRLVFTKVVGVEGAKARTLETRDAIVKKATRTNILDITIFWNYYFE